jgi:hypothetical protein
MNKNDFKLNIKHQHKLFDKNIYELFKQNLDKKLLAKTQELIIINELTQGFTINAMIKIIINKTNHNNPF